MKNLLLLSAAFMLSMVLHAQEANPVVIVSTTGKVGLISADKSKSRPVQAGAVAKNTGKLKLAAGAKATILCDGQFKEVSGGQTALLSSLCTGNKSSQKLDVDFDFGEKVMAAVEMVAVAQKRGDGWSNALTDPKKSGDGWGTALTDPKKSGDGWGTALTDPKKSGDGWGTALTDPKKSGDGWGTALTDPKKSGDGWGGKGSNIRLIMPFGKVKAAATAFSWSKPANAGAYLLQITDSEGKSLKALTVTDTFALVDLNALGLVSEQFYRWKVTVPKNNALISNELEFGLGTTKDWEQTMQEAGGSALVHSTQNPVLQTLVEAVALENKEWFYAASLSYAGLAKNNPDNLVRMMHAAFWKRYGFHKLAEKAIGKR